MHAGKQSSQYSSWQENVVSQSSALSDMTTRVQMSPLSAQNREHVVIHAGSIILAVITQVISSIFFALTQDSYVPNGE